MTLTPSFSQILQWFAWTSFFLEAVLLAYLVLLNLRHPASTGRQRWLLRTRLTFLLLAITAPILTGGVVWVTVSAVRVVEKQESQRLEVLNAALLSNAEVWVDLHAGVLSRLVSDPAIVSMDPAQQRALLEMMAETHPTMYLVSTLDLTGMNVTRSDALPPEHYAAQDWFQAVLDGAPQVFQVALDPAINAPALIGAMPIRDREGNLVGVGMFACALSDVAAQVRTRQVGNTGYTYIVDSENRLLAHPDLHATTPLTDMSTTAPVEALRAGRGPWVKFATDDARWWAVVREGGPGWGIVVQQQEAELLSGMRSFMQSAWLVGWVGVAMLALAFFLTLRQAFRPIASMTETVNAIAAGDLSRAVIAEGPDELSMLGRAFNSMTTQLRELIHSLESRVAERTRELEQRATYLAVTGQVSRVANAILDVEELLPRVAHLITDRFGFYHIAIFMLDESREWAVLRAASSEGGRNMLARGHRLRVGEQGIVGYVSGTGRPRIALDVDVDAVWMKSLDLPTTRSEMALPLSVGNRLLGVLDIQSEAPNAFSTEDVETLRVLADQIAIAIQNAQLFQDSQRALQELQRAYGETGEQGWRARASALLGYRYTPEETRPIPYLTEMPSDTVESTHITAANTLVSPLRMLGGRTFGALRLNRPATHPWTSQEMQFVQQAAQGIAQALEVARLLEETRDRAARDRLVGEIGGQLRATLDPDVIMKTTVQALGRLLQAELTTIEVSGAGEVSRA